MSIIKKITDWFIGAEPATVPVGIGRNEPCHCGSDLKYKRCCLEADKVIARKYAACSCNTKT